MRNIEEFLITLFIFLLFSDFTMDFYNFDIPVISPGMPVQRKKRLPIHTLKRRGGAVYDEPFRRASFPSSSSYSFENFMRDAALSNVYLPHVDIVAAEMEFGEDSEEEIQKFIAHLRGLYSDDVFKCLLPYVPSIFLISMVVEYATRGFIRRFCFEPSVIMKCYQIIKYLPYDPSVNEWDIKQVTRILFYVLCREFSLPVHYSVEIMNHEEDLVYYLRMKYNMLYRYLIHDYPRGLRPAQYASAYLTLIVNSFASIEKRHPETILDYMFGVKSIDELWYKVYHYLNDDNFNDFGLLCQDINDALIRIISTNLDTRKTVFKRSLEWAICNSMAKWLSS